MDSRLNGLGRMRLASRAFDPSAPNLLPLPSPSAKQPDSDDNSKNGNNNNTQGKGGQNQGGHGTSNVMTSSSELPHGCSLNNLRPSAPHCTFTNDNDGSLQYSDGWIFSTSDPNGLIHSVHFAQNVGASVSLIFNTTSIIIFGLLPSGSSPPEASYSIDGQAPTSPNLAATNACVPNQVLFTSGELGPGPHNLTITVTEASVAQPYILDYLWLCNLGSTTSEASSSSTTSTKERHELSPKDGVIIGAVLGAVFLFLAIVFCAWLYIRRRRKHKAQLRKLHLAASPVASWLYWNSQSDRDERRTVLTSSEEILADNPTYSSSSTRKDMSYRKAVPAVSAPPSVRMSAVSKATLLTRPASFEPPGLEDPGGYPRRMERAPSIALPF